MELSLSDHKFTTGHYAVHLYAKNTSTGKRQGVLASQGFDVTEAQVKNFQPSLTTNLGDKGIAISYQSV
ncbi:hypothetical protein K6V78_09395 [Streptococcus gallolyticus]|nr:hypothetical protein [Streptococcus gallolyticus]MBY5041713.1 hypothetical protein [Streptococcus gallolyticus]